MAIAKISGFQAYAVSVLRIVAGFTLFCHGLQKLIGAFGGLGGHGATARLTSLLGIAGVLETIGGSLILVGLLTRPSAFILCGEMAVAYFRQHAPRGRWPIANGGELAVLYCFIFLFLITAGAGPWSLDRVIRKR